MKRIICLLLAASISPVALAANKKKTDKVDVQFEQLFNNVDADQNGTISKAEAELKAPAMAESFEMIDADRNGELTKQEIKSFTAIMLKSREEFTKQLDNADKNKNGQLSLAESKAIPKLHDNFDAIDTNHDGQLVIKEISDFLRAQLDAQKATK